MGALEHSRQKNLILKLSKGYLMGREALPPFQIYFSCKLNKQGWDEQTFYQAFHRNHHPFHQSRCFWSRWLFRVHWGPEETSSCNHNLGDRATEQAEWNCHHCSVSPPQQDSALCACKVCLSTTSSPYGDKPDLRRSMSITYWKPHLGLSWAHRSHRQYLPVGGGGMAAGSGLVDGAPGPPWG